ncbi:MAG TPA: adenine phosphoribosyltransferase [Prolixibacteraceae bacterium]|nr:adenine phosphoribosyltransferase [Prolixibacteraceae bacterium]
MNLKERIREVSDFPKAGISFKDITTLFKDSDSLKYTTDVIVDNFKGENITKVLGIEARGFMLGGAIACGLNAGFIPVRKVGKLPAETISETYELEYGVDSIEMHADALNEDDVILIHDDLLATGGTAFATLNLVKRAGVKNIYFSFICDLEFIKTEIKEKIKEHNTQVLVKYS